MMNKGAIVELFKDRRVLVIGDAILDVYLSGISTRLCREAPAPVVSLQRREASGGGAANTVVNLAALGARPSFATVIGADPAGQELREILEGAGADTTPAIIDAGRRTPSKTRISASGSIIARIDEGVSDEVSPHAHDALAAWVRRNASAFDAIILSDYRCGVVECRLVEALREMPARPPLIVDAREPERYRELEADVLKPNYEEVCTLLDLKPLPGSERVAQVMQQADVLLERSGAKAVFATLDADGVVVVERDRHPFYLPTRARPHSRSIGAGDSFVAAMTLALCSGARPADAAAVAQTAAEVVLDKEGTAVCKADELLRALAGGGKYHDSITTLSRQLDELRRQGRRIVFTNGCFDVLHRGHVDFLRQARRLGDFLVVALNSDTSIRRVKGPGRPINTLQDRIEVLSGLQCVDALVAFEDDTPIELLRQLRPEIFVKGRAHASQVVPEAELVKALGGEVRLIPSSGASTGQLLSRIRGETSSMLLRDDGYRP